MSEPSKGMESMSLRRALELDSTRSTFPTGSVVDGLLGGGLRTREMAEFFGASNSGKTQLAMQSAVSVASLGHQCVYVDTEGQFRPERVAEIAQARGFEPENVLRRVYTFRAESTRRQSEAITMASGLQGCRLVVVDTVTKNFTLELGGERSVGRRQTALGAYLNRLARDAYFHDRAVLLLNRVATVSAGETSAEVDIGGQTIRHFVQRAVRMRRRGGQVIVSLEEPEGGETTTRIGIAGLE